MSEEPAATTTGEQQGQGSQQAQALIKYIKTSKESVLKIKQFDFKKLFTDIIVFISIVAAYFVISLTYQLNNQFQKLIKLNLTKLDSLALLVYIFSLYLVFLNVLKKYLYNRALKKPAVVDEYAEAVPEEEKYYKQLPVLADGQKYSHQIVSETCTKLIEFSIFLTAVLTYVFVNQSIGQKLPSQKINYQRINYIIVWSLGASFFELSGRFIGKWTKLQEFSFFGRAQFFIIAVLALGLANGQNTFIFI